MSPGASPSGAGTLAPIFSFTILDLEVNFFFFFLCSLCAEKNEAEEQEEKQEIKRRLSRKVP